MTPGRGRPRRSPALVEPGRAQPAATSSTADLDALLARDPVHRRQEEAAEVSARISGCVMTRYAVREWPSRGLRSATQNRPDHPLPGPRRARGRAAVGHPLLVGTERPATSWRGAPGRKPTAPPASLTRTRGRAGTRGCLVEPLGASNPRGRSTVDGAPPSGASSTVPTGSRPAERAARIERPLLCRHLATTGRPAATRARAPSRPAPPPWRGPDPGPRPRAGSTG